MLASTFEFPLSCLINVLIDKSIKTESMSHNSCSGWAELRSWELLHLSVSYLLVSVAYDSAVTATAGSRLCFPARCH